MGTLSDSHGGLRVDPDHVRGILVRFLRDETRAAGFERGVLGISGGVDSALCAFLAAEALGRDNVTGVMMPYRTSSPRTREDAELVVTTLGIRHEVVDITPMVDAYLARAVSPDRIRAGNVMARQRMIVLYDISARDRSLVLGTSNKTEILLGYGTIFGDTACALNPLGDLYKSQVWQLAAHVGVPKQILEKPPSADLWEGQTDEEEMGLKYAQVDRLLTLLVDERRAKSELVSAGFEPGMIEKVERMIRLNQFKRYPPVIAKLHDRTGNANSPHPHERGT